MKHPCSFCYGTGRTMTLGGADVACRGCFGTGIRNARPNSYQGPCFVCKKHVSSYAGILVIGRPAHEACALKYCKER